MWRRRQRREGGCHLPRDGCLEPPEAGKDGKDPPLEPLLGAQPWEALTSDVWPPGLREDRFAYFNNQVCSTWLMQTQGTLTEGCTGAPIQVVTVVLGQRSLFLLQSVGFPHGFPQPGRKPTAALCHCSTEAVMLMFSHSVVSDSL